jgi:hypothetical protein
LGFSFDVLGVDRSVTARKAVKAWETPLLTYRMGMPPERIRHPSPEKMRQSGVF